MGCVLEQDTLSQLLQLTQLGTSMARGLTCDRPASYPGGVLYSHPLALLKPGISTGLMSLKAREGFYFLTNYAPDTILPNRTPTDGQGDSSIPLNFIAGGIIITQNFNLESILRKCSQNDMPFLGSGTDLGDSSM